jgi:hypothetical protein
MTKKLRGLTAVALAATALFAAQPAAADIIELNGWWAGGTGFGMDHITYAGLPHNVNANVAAGGFRTYDLTTDPSKGNAFQSFCVDIFDSFGFVADSYSHSVVVTSQAATDLGRLYTNHHNLIDSTSSTGGNEAAFQLAVWEIVNEGDTNYNLGAGKFKATGADVSLAQNWLDELAGSSRSQYNAKFWLVDSMKSGTGYAQDIVVFNPVPEPQTYAMMLVGLGLLGFSARRRNKI